MWISISRRVRRVVASSPPCVHINELYRSSIKEEGGAREGPQCVARVHVSIIARSVLKPLPSLGISLSRIQQDPTVKFRSNRIYTGCNQIFTRQWNGAIIVRDPSPPPPTLDANFEDSFTSDWSTLAPSSRPREATLPSRSREKEAWFIRNYVSHRLHLRE